MGAAALQSQCQEVTDRLLRTCNHHRSFQRHTSYYERCNIRTLLGDVIDQESSYSTSVVGASDCTISLLSSCVPDLRLDGLSINLHI